MNNLKTQTLFLITGLVTAAGANKKDSKLKLAHSLVEEEQYIAAIYTAEQIITHYPKTIWAESAEELIEIIKTKYLQRSQPSN